MDKWTEAANAVYEETRVALQTVYNALNQGQQKKILKDAGVKELFDRYGVEYAE
jgi:Fe2+ or Zn2+ uptake regulation protein